MAVPLRYDMRLADAAEGRLDEIAFANPGRAQELLALFNKACFSLSKVYADLQFQDRLIKDRLDKRRAVMVVDEIPARLKAKGLQDNVMSRQAFLDLDEEYGAASSIENAVEAAIIFVEKRLKAMEGALSSIKKIYDAQNGSYRRQNPNLPTEGISSAPDLRPPVEASAVPPVTKTSTGFQYGKANYGTNHD